MAKRQKLPEDLKTRAITLVLPVATYDRLKALCDANYRNVPQTIRFLIDAAYIDQELSMSNAHNISNPTTVGAADRLFRSGSDLSGLSGLSA